MSALNPTRNTCQDIAPSINPAPLNKISEGHHDGHTRPNTAALPKDTPVPAANQSVDPHCAATDLARSHPDGTGKPKEEITGACHECSTGLPIANPFLAIDAGLLQQLLDTFQSYQQTPPLMKTDVFMAPAVNDNPPIPTTTSLASSSYWTPILSPVTLPSDFLCDHEPLFDGIQDLQQATDDSHSDNEPDAAKDTHPDTLDACSPTAPVEWDVFSDDDLLQALPTPSQTASEVDSVIGDILDVGDDESNDGDTVASDTGHYSYAITSDSLKRKRSQSEDNEPEASIQNFANLRITDTSRQNKADKKTRRRVKRYTGRRQRIRSPPPDDTSIGDDQDQQFTLFEKLTLAGIDWCRYCGTTEGVNWRPGPWGKRTLCNKHGCDYKGYGIASRLPRLDLSAFANEPLKARKRPVLQQFCVVCHSSNSEPENQLVACQGGCSRAYHQHCRVPTITNECLTQQQPWCCSALCLENRKRNKVDPYDFNSHPINRSQSTLG